MIRTCVLILFLIATVTSHAQDVFRVFGDSTTQTVPSWADFVADTFFWQLDNQSHTGDYLIQMLNRAFVPAVLEDTQTGFQCCVNDSRETNAAFRTTFEAMVPLTMVYHAVPDAKKAFGTNAALVSTTGTWAKDPKWGGFGLASTHHDATATATVEGSVIYLASRLSTAKTGGSFAVSVDGRNAGSWHCFGANEGRLPSSVYTNFPFLVRIPDLEPGPHQVRVTVLSADGAKNWVWVDWLAGNKAAERMPAVWFGNTTRRTPEAYLAAGGSDAIVASQNGVINDAAQRLAGDGLNVFAVDLATAFDPNRPGEGSSGTQPNDTGKGLMAKAVEDEIDVAERTSLRLVSSGGTLRLSWLMSLSGYALSSSDGIGVQPWQAVPGVTGNSVSVPQAGIQANRFFTILHTP